MTQQEIKSIVDKFADLARVLTDADPDDKAEIFRQVGLKPTYHPGRQKVRAQIEAPQHWSMVSEGDYAKRPMWHTVPDQRICA